MSNTDEDFMDWFAEFWEWLLTFLSGEKRLSEDYVPKAGDEIGITNKYTIVEGEGDDANVIAAMDSVSNAEIEQEFYAAGLDVTVTNRRSQTVSPKHAWTHEVDFDVHSAGTPPLAILALVYLAPIITAVIYYFIVREVTATVDKVVDKSEAGIGLSVNILLTGIIILALIWFFMSVMRR